MTEQNPHDESGADDTRRLTDSTTGGSTHRYGEAGPTPDRQQSSSPYAAPGSSSYGPASEPNTARFGGFGFADRTDEGRPDRTRPSRPSGAVVAGLLVAALVAGGLGGLAGGAGFTAIDDLVGGGSASEASPAGSQSSAVVDRKDVAPAADSVEGVAKTVLPSVVKINVKGAQGEGSGSGIIISSDGEILTNNHVVALAGQSGELSVNFNDGSAKKATVVGTDPLTDLAVIKAEGVSGLTPARIGNSNDLAVGEEVVAVGSPFGLDATVTEGIVSSLNRPVTVSEGSSSTGGTDTAYPAIQTDAAINPGNSGGPLVNMAGQVVGINSSIYSSSSSMGGGQAGSIGLGFSIPISKVLPVVEQLRQGETPTHARLGVTVSNQQNNEGLTDGAAIQSVGAGTAAAKAGLKAGDVVTKVDDDVVTGSDSLVATIRGHRPGDKVTLTVVESGDKTRTLDVTLDSDKGSASS